MTAGIVIPGFSRAETSETAHRHFLTGRSDGPTGPPLACPRVAIDLTKE